jgi:hypothetical protein
MPRTTEQTLAEQRRVADADRRQRLAAKLPMLANLTPPQRLQWRAWGWCDTRARSKGKYETRPNKGRVAPPVASTGKSVIIDQRGYSL